MRRSASPTVGWSPISVQLLDIGSPWKRKKAIPFLPRHMEFGRDPASPEVDEELASPADEIHVEGAGKVPGLPSGARNGRASGLFRGPEERETVGRLDPSQSAHEILERRPVRPGLVDPVSGALELRGSQPFPWCG